MRAIFAAGIAAGVALAESGASAAMAATSTTCLCRTADNTAFQEKTHRHHRWACDFKLGYAHRNNDDSTSVRPKTETCNAEEIIQYKVWACIERGCTYQYSKRLEEKNPALEVIEPMEGKRTP
jgi:hypothetical protein